jgi:hypothetical protein
MENTLYRPPRKPLVAAGEIDHHIADLSATIAADLTLTHVQEQLARHEQWLPIDGDPSTTMGRLVAQNSTGPLRLGYGAWRDLLLGCQFTNGRGDLITAGGRTMKNVAGYDLTKLMVGQCGTLGCIVTITTRTYRRPVGAILATFDADVRRVNSLLPTPLRPQWMAMTGQSLLCGFFGDEPTLEFYEANLRRAEPRSIVVRSLAEDTEDRRQLWTHPTASGIAFRASVPPLRVLEFAASAGLDTWTADPVFGIVVGKVASEAVTDLRRIAKEHDATLITPSDPAAPADPVAANLMSLLTGAFA